MKSSDKVSERLHEQSMSALDALHAMRHYLKRHFDQTADEELAYLLTATGMLEDGGTADPNALLDWEESVRAVLGGERVP